MSLWSGSKCLDVCYCYSGIHYYSTTSGNINVFDLLSACWLLYNNENAVVSCPLCTINYIPTNYIMQASVAGYVDRTVISVNLK